MKIIIGSDHAGYELKEGIKKFLAKQGYKTEDLTEKKVPGDDYPTIAFKVAKKITKKTENTGILICGTGIGMSIAANKIKGARAAVCRTIKEAELARKHNHANILCLGGRITNKEKAKKITKKFLETNFEKGRHERRIRQIIKEENKK